MQGFDEFRDEDDNDAGVAPHPPVDVPPVIGVGAGASVASAGAALLGLKFRQTRRTFEELMEGEVIAGKQDHGVKGSKTYIAIRKSATTPLPDKLLGPRFLGAKNKEGELLNRNQGKRGQWSSSDPATGTSTATARLLHQQCLDDKVQQGLRMEYFPHHQVLR